MDIIFYYIKNPYRILNTSPNTISIWHSLCAILLGSLSIGSSLGNLNIGFIISLFTCVVIIMILNAITIDFVAQLLSYDAKSMLLFKILSLSCLLIIFFKPIELLHNHISPGLSTLLYICCFGYIGHIQCKTIQTTYGIPRLTATLLWIIPSLLSLGSIVAIILVISQLISTYI